MFAFINYWPLDACRELQARAGAPLKRTRVENLIGSGLHLGAYLYVIIVEGNSTLLVGRMIADEYGFVGGRACYQSLEMPAGTLEIIGMGGGTPVQLRRTLDAHAAANIAFVGEKVDCGGQPSVSTGYSPYGIRRVSIDSAMMLDDIVDAYDELGEV